MNFHVAFRTFGCKLNQAETDSIADSFAKAGAVVVDFDSGADVVVFNTCTVTSKAEQKARREMRLALRRNPEAIAIVTGCYAELDGEAVSAIAPRTVVIPGSRKDHVRAIAPGLVSAALEGLDLLDEARRLDAELSGRSPDPFAFVPSDARFHTRVQLKVQDGCNNRCTYCRVCLARGRSVSLDPGEAIARSAALEASGVAEIVLTGVNLSQYGAGGLDLPGLLGHLIGGTAQASFRVSSYEPDRVDDAFVRAFALPRVRPHLHLSVQSGSDRILGAMGRHYTRDQVLRAADAVRSVRADPFIGADIILGFPGETDADFADTVDLLRRLEPAWVHAFTFSPRPGTRAFAMKPRVPERVAVERAAVIQAIARDGKARFAARRVGTIARAVADASVPHEPPVADTHGGADSASTVIATTADYLKVAVSGVPAGYRGEFACLVESPSAAEPDEGGADLIAHFVGQD